MKKILISDIENEVILAKPLLRPDGKVLMAAGVEIKPSMAKRLQNWGVTVAFVKEKEEGKPEENDVSDKRIHKLEHTYKKVKNNPKMKFLFDEIRKHLNRHDQ